MMSKKYKVALILISIGLAWHYFTVTAITYGPFEIQVITPEPMEDIVLVLTYDVTPTYGLIDDYYYKVRVVKSGEWVTFPAGKFYSGGKPSLLTGVYHPELSSKDFGLFASATAEEQWDGGSIKFPPLKVKRWQGREIGAHLMRMNRSYLKYFPLDERKKLHKYVSILEQQIDNVSDVDERDIRIARNQLERFKAATQ